MAKVKFSNFTVLMSLKIKYNTASFEALFPGFPGSNIAIILIRNGASDLMTNGIAIITVLVSMQIYPL